MAIETIHQELSSSQKEFESLLNDDFKDRKLKENEIIKATVTELTKNFVVCDVKAKMEGMIPIEEFKHSKEYKDKLGDYIGPDRTYNPDDIDWNNPPFNKWMNRYGFGDSGEKRERSNRLSPGPEREYMREHFTKSGQNVPTIEEQEAELSSIKLDSEIKHEENLDKIAKLRSEIAEKSTTISELNTKT